MSAGGYHHHLGVNVWNSRGAAPPPSDALGLVNYQIVLPTEASRQTLLTRLDALNYPIEQWDAESMVRDSAGNGIVLVVLKVNSI